MRDETRCFTVMVVVPVLIGVAGVARPVELIVATVVSEETQDTDGDDVKSCVIVGVVDNVAMAVNCCVESGVMVAVMVAAAGDTIRDDRSATLSVAEEERLFNGSVAVMMTVPLTPVVVDEVARPLAFISTMVDEEVQITAVVQFTV